MTTGRRRVSFRITLLARVVVLLACTVVTIAVVGAVISTRSVRDLETRYFDATAAGSRVRALFEPAVSVLGDTQGLARQGRSSCQDGEDLRRPFGESLRHLRTVAWRSFGEEASRRIVGVWRREDGSCVLNRSNPVVGGGRPMDHELAADGTLGPVDRPRASDYDPRQAAWYRQATGAQGPI